MYQCMNSVYCNICFQFQSRLFPSKWIMTYVLVNGPQFPCRHTVSSKSIMVLSLFSNFFYSLILYVCAKNVREHVIIDVQRHLTIYIVRNVCVYLWKRMDTKKNVLVTITGRPKVDQNVFKSQKYKEAKYIFLFLWWSLCNHTLMILILYNKINLWL